MGGGSAETYLETEERGVEHMKPTKLYVEHKLETEISSISTFL